MTSGTTASGGLLWALINAVAVAATALGVAWTIARIDARVRGSALERWIARRRARAPQRRRLAAGLRVARRVLVIGSLAAVISVPIAGVAGAYGDYAYHGTDLLDFNAPQTQCVTNTGAAAPCVGSYYGAYPWGSYDLDQHIGGVSVGLTGIDLSGLPALAFYTISWILWELALLGLHIAFLIFGFAFSLNLITSAPGTGGSQFTHGVGLLNGLHGAVSGLFHAGPFQDVLFVTFAAIGLYALWNGLVKQRYVRTLAGVAVSVLIYAAALAIIADPANTIGWAADTTNQLADSALSLTATVASDTPVNSGAGGLQTNQGSLLTAQDALFKLAVFQPFEILDFGGLDHCTANAPAGPNAGISVADPTSGATGCAPYPGSKHVTTHPIPNQKYADWYLEADNPQCDLQLEQAALLANENKLVNHQFQMLVPEGTNPSCKIGPFDGHPNGALAPNVNSSLSVWSQAGGSSPAASPIGGMRNEIFTAIEEVSAKQQSTPGIQSDPLGMGLQKALAVNWPDTPAVDAQLENAQGQRLAVAVLVLIGSIPLVFILGGLSIGVVVAQLEVLFGLVVLPVLLLAGLFPGRGHQLFYLWGKRMLTALIRKFIYALVLVVLLTIEFGIIGAAQLTGFGWLFEYLIQIAFFWVVMAKRRKLVGHFNQALTSHQPQDGSAGDEFARAYRRTRLARMGSKTAKGTAIAATAGVSAAGGAILGAFGLGSRGPKSGAGTSDSPPPPPPPSPGGAADDRPPDTPPSPNGEGPDGPIDPLAPGSLPDGGSGTADLPGVETDRVLDDVDEVEAAHGELRTPSAPSGAAGQREDRQRLQTSLNRLGSHSPERLASAMTADQRERAAALADSENMPHVAARLREVKPDAERDELARTAQTSRANRAAAAEAHRTQQHDTPTPRPGNGSREAPPTRRDAPPPSPPGALSPNAPELGDELQRLVRDAERKPPSPPPLPPPNGTP